MINAGIPLTNLDAIKAARAVSLMTNNTMSEVYNIEADEPPTASASPSKDSISNPNILRDIESLIEQMEQNQAKQNENMIKNIEGLLGSLLKKVNSAPSSHGSIEQLRVKSPIPQLKRSNKEIYELKSFINDHIQEINPDFTRQLQTEMRESEQTVMGNDIRNFVEQEMHVQQLEEQFEQMGSKPNLNHDNLLLISMEENKTDIETSTEQESSSVSQYSEALDDVFHSETLGQPKNQNDNENSIEEIEKWLENIMQTADEMTPENLLALNNATLSHVKRNSVESARQKGASSRQSSSFQSVGDYHTSNSTQDMSYVLDTLDKESHDLYLSELNSSSNHESNMIIQNEHTIEIKEKTNPETTESTIYDINVSLNANQRSEEVVNEFSSKINETAANKVSTPIESASLQNSITESFDIENINLNAEKEPLSTNNLIVSTNKSSEDNELILSTEDDSESKSIVSEHDGTIRFSINQGQYTRTVARYYKKILRQRKKAQKSAQLLLLKKLNGNNDLISNIGPALTTSVPPNDINNGIHKEHLHNKLDTNVQLLVVPSESVIHEKEAVTIVNNQENTQAVMIKLKHRSSSSSSNSDSTTLANITPLDSPDSSSPKIGQQSQLSDLVENTQKLIKQMKEEINSDILTFASGESEEEYSSIEDKSDEWTDDVSDEEIFEDSYMSNFEEDERDVTPIMFDAEENGVATINTETAQQDIEVLGLKNEAPVIDIQNHLDNSAQDINIEDLLDSEKPPNDIESMPKESVKTSTKVSENTFIENVNQEAQIQQIIQTVRNAEIMFELEDNENFQENVVEIPLEVNTVHVAAQIVDDLVIASVEDIKIETTTETTTLTPSVEVVNDKNIDEGVTIKDNAEYEVVSNEIIQTDVIAAVVANEVEKIPGPDKTKHFQETISNTTNTSPEDELNMVQTSVHNLLEDLYDSEQNDTNLTNNDPKAKINPKQGKPVIEKKRKSSLEINSNTQKSSSNTPSKQNNNQKKVQQDLNISKSTKIVTRKASLDSQNNQKSTMDTRKKSLPIGNFRSPFVSNVSKIQSQLLTKTATVSQPKTTKVEQSKAPANKSGSVATFASKLSKLISPTASSSKNSSPKSAVTNNSSNSSTQAGPSTSRLPVPIETKIPKKKYHETCFSDDYQTTDDEDERNKASSVHVPVRTLIKASNFDYQIETAEPETLEVSMKHPKISHL